MKIKKTPLALVLIFSSGLFAIQKQPSLHFDYKSAEAMMKVIQALHRQDEDAVIQKLLDEALEFKAYKVYAEFVERPGRYPRQQEADYHSSLLYRCHQES